MSSSEQQPTTTISLQQQIHPRIEFEKSILFRKKDCPTDFIYFKRDTDTRKRKTEGIPKKVLTVDISHPEFPPQYYSQTSSIIKPTHFSVVLICQQQCANNTRQILKARDHIFLHPNQTTRDVPFNIPLAKGKIRNREFIFVGVDHDTGMVFPMEWKLHDDASYYSGFFKVLSRNTRGEGVQKQVDQGLSVMTDELWKCITRVATERDSPMIQQSSSSSSPQPSSPLLKRELKQVDGDDDDDEVNNNNNNNKRRRIEEPPVCSSPTIAVTSPVGVTVVMESSSSSSPFSPTDCSTSYSSSPLSSPILMFDNDELDVSGALSVLNEVMSCTDEELLPIDPFMSQFLEDHDSFELPSSSTATASPLIGCDSMMNMSQMMMMNNVCMTNTATATTTTITPATNTLATLNGVTEDYFVATNSAACAEFDFLLFNNYSFSIEEQPLSEISVSPAVMRPGLSSVVNLSHQSPFFSALEC